MDNWVKNKEAIPSVVGGYCAIWATILSVFQIMEHLATFTQPEKQCKIVRVVFMVPIYAMISWLSLLFRGAAPYLDLIRDAYESYALYNFFTLMLELMGGIDALYRTLMTEERDLMHHYFPLCYLPPFKVGPRFVQLCHRCMFQFMVLKPLCTFIVLILEAKDMYGDSVLDASKGYLWMTLIYNISITIAFTALVYFYGATRSLLEGQSPLGKFLCIKSVIFLSFWQGVVIEILHALDVLPHLEYWTQKEVATGLQDFAICVEMLFVSFAHKFCFGSQEYCPKPGSLVRGTNSDEGMGGDTFAPPPSMMIASLPRSTPWTNLKYTLRHEDVIRDIQDIWYGR
eukprot:PhF_6_TR6139/c0_g1_i2/m.9113